jgi:hypothetical protein
MKTIGVACFLTSCASYACGEPERMPDAAWHHDPLEIRTITLTHAPADSMIGAIKSLGLRVFVAPVPDNRLILRGKSEDVQVVVDQLIAKVDTPASSTGRTTVEYIPVSHIPSGSLMPLLEAVEPDPFRRHYALDASNRLLVVNGSAESIAAIRKLIQAVDKPVESLQMHFAFLRAKIGAAAAEPAVVPGELAPAVKALQQSGFSNVTSIAPLGVHAKDGAHFESAATLYSDDHGGQLQFSVEGTARLYGDGSTVNLDLNASVKGPHGEPGAKQKHTWFELKSSIAAKLGSYVILAAAPSTTADGDAVILAVRITRGGA